MGSITPEEDPQPYTPKGFNWNDPIAILDLVVAVVGVLRDKGVIKQQDNKYDSTKDMPKDKDTGEDLF